MTILKDIYKAVFGKNHDAVWEQFAKENFGNYSTINENRVEILHNGFLVTFDTYTNYTVVGGSSYDKEYTRVRVEIISPDELKLSLVQQWLFENIGKLFGKQDIRIGEYEFDKRFSIKGSSEFKIQTLFSNETIRYIILSNSNLFLSFGEEGNFDEKVPDGFSLLYYFSEDKIKHINQLNNLLKLFILLIDSLIKLGSAKPKSQGQTRSNN